MTRILVVEDDATMRRLLMTLLKMEGYDLIEGSDIFDEVMQAIEKNCPDIILLDVNLKQCSGLDIARSIQNKIPSYRPYILMTSGIEMSDQCAAVGADGFLLKPYMPSELTDWLKEKIDKKRG